MSAGIPLPPADITRWTRHRKAEVVEAVRRERIPLAAAMRRWGSARRIPRVGAALRSLRHAPVARAAARINEPVRIRPLSVAGRAPHLLFRGFDHDEAPTLRLVSGFGFHSLLSCS